MYYSDFTMLGTERNSGMSMGAIPVTRIILYAQLEGVLNSELFKRVITGIDHAYIGLVNDEQGRKSKANSKRKP